MSSSSWRLTLLYQVPRMAAFGFTVVGSDEAFIRQVCDGHGGEDAAQFASKNLLRFFLTDNFLCSDVHEALVSRLSVVQGGYIRALVAVSRPEHLKTV